MHISGCSEKAIEGTVAMLLVVVLIVIAVTAICRRGRRRRSCGRLVVVATFHVDAAS